MEDWTVSGSLAGLGSVPTTGLFTMALVRKNHRMDRPLTQRVSIVWASEKESGRAKHISEVRRGLACGCACAGCGGALEAVNSENPHPKRRMHFRHANGDETLACVNSAVLAGAKAQIQPGETLTLPAYIVTGSARAPDGLQFNAIEQAAQSRVSIDTVHWVDEVDALLTLSNGRQLRVRLVAVSSSLKIQRLGDNDAAAEILIDVSDPSLRDASPDELRSRITLDTSAKRWCHHWQVDSLSKSAIRLAEDKAARHWTAKQMRSDSGRNEPPIAPISRVVSELDSSVATWQPAPSPLSQQRMAGRQFMWAASRQVAAEDRQKALTMGESFHRVGSVGSTQRIDYAVVIEDAIAARAANVRLQQKLDEWRSRYQLQSLKPILCVLLAARVIR